MQRLMCLRPERQAPPGKARAGVTARWLLSPWCLSTHPGPRRGHPTPSFQTGQARLTVPLRLGLVPVVSDADVDGERRIELEGAHHFLPEQVFHGAHLRVRRLDQELVVHLEDEPRRAALLPQTP